MDQEHRHSKEPGFDLKTCFTTHNDENVLGYVKDENYYYDSYSHFSIHEEMLKDNIRTKAYQSAILKNAALFKNKIVLDVGAGTGILSIFAARAGAKHVYAVENANIAMNAQQIIKDNKLSHKITVIKGKIEEIELPVQKVDIIISEWMGYFLLYESMLDCVIYARDKYLQEDGMMFPDQAILYLASIEDEEYRATKLDFWDNVYGVDMSSIKLWVLREPLVDSVEREALNSHSCVILNLDLKTVKVEDLDFSTSYELRIFKDDRVHALIAWFDVIFCRNNLPIKLSTSPFGQSTHWKQTVFYIDQPVDVRQNDHIKGSIAVKKMEDNPRNLDIKLSFQLNKGEKQIQYYKMN